MKLDFPQANVVAVTPGMQHHGEELVPCKAIKVRAQELPEKLLPQFSDALHSTLFVGGVPRIPGLGECAWAPEYEHAVVAVGSVRLKDAKIEKITFRPLATGMVEMVFTILVTSYSTNESGELDALLKHTARVKVEKATQIELIPDDPPGSAAEGQGTLPEITPLRPDLSTPAKKKAKARRKGK